MGSLSGAKLEQSTGCRDRQRIINQQELDELRKCLGLPGGRNTKGKVVRDTNFLAYHQVQCHQMFASSHLAARVGTCAEAPLGQRHHSGSILAAPRPLRFAFGVVRVPEHTALDVTLLKVLFQTIRPFILCVTCTCIQFLRCPP